MLHLSTTWGAWQIDVWSEASTPGGRNEDGWLVDERPGGVLRLAVIDGVTPMAGTPRYLGVNGAVHAANTVRGALLGEGDLATCAVAANGALCDPAVMPPRRRPSATLAACDITASGAVAGIRCADARAWAFRGGVWQECAPGGRYTDAADAASRALAARGLPRDQFLAAEAELTADPSAWRSAPVGVFATLRPVTFRCDPGWDALVLATDGALLDPGRLKHLDAWLGGELRRQEVALRAGVEAKARDDVTVIRLLCAP